MNPSSLSWLLSVKSTANQMKVASTSPCWRCLAGEDAGGEQDAEAEKRDGGRIDPERCGRPRERPCRRTRRARSSRAARAAPAPRARLGRPAPRALPAARAISQKRNGGIRAMPASVGTEAATSHDPKPISTPKVRAISAHRVGGHRRQPQRRRQAQAGDAGEHQEARRGAVLSVAGLRAGRVGQRERQRIEDARTGGVARKRRRDERVHQEDAVRQPERGPAEHASRSSGRCACPGRTSPPTVRRERRGR